MYRGESPREQSLRYCSGFGRFGPERPSDRKHSSRLAPCDFAPSRCRWRTRRPPRRGRLREQGKSLPPPKLVFAQLSARRAGVHVDFHANLHFSDLRLFPYHWILLSQHTIVYDYPGSNRGNHGPIVGTPVAPHIAAAIPEKSATQTAGVVTVTAMAVTGSTTERPSKVTAAKNITPTTGTITTAARKCGASDSKNNCKSDYGVAQH